MESPAEDRTGEPPAKITVRTFVSTRCRDHPHRRMLCIDVRHHRQGDPVDTHDLLRRIASAAAATPDDPEGAGADDCTLSADLRLTRQRSE
jgi:hypothetical protein